MSLEDFFFLMCGPGQLKYLNYEGAWWLSSLMSIFPFLVQNFWLWLATLKKNTFLRFLRWGHGKSWLMPCNSSLFGRLCNLQSNNSGASIVIQWVKSLLWKLAFHTGSMPQLWRHFKANPWMKGICFLSFPLPFKLFLKRSVLHTYPLRYNSSPYSLRNGCES